MIKIVLIVCLFFSFSSPDLVAGILDDFEKNVLTKPKAKSKSKPKPKPKKESNKKHSGVLGDFEKNVTTRPKNKPKPKKDNRETHHRHHSIYSSSYNNCGVFQDCFMDEFFWRAMGVMVLMPVEWGKMSAARTHGTEPFPPSIVPRVIGEPLLPYVRFDTYYQNANGDVRGVDLKMEFGYSLVALNLRRTRFRESFPLKPSNELDLSYIHGLFRMSLGNRVGVNIGYGRAILKGNSKTSGGSVTLPLLFHWSERFGVEGSYTASRINGNRIKDAEISLLVKESLASLSLGYRSVRVSSSKIQGPFIGFSMRW